jgi:hypothetical protein
MSEPTPIRIRPKLYQEIKDEMPEIFADTTTWVNYLVQVGYNYHVGLDACGRLKTERPTKKETQGEKVFYTSKVHNTRINKEKSKIFSLNSTPPPIHLEFCKDLIEKFWEVKKGSRSKEAYQLLIGPKGLGGISKNHGETAVKDQLEEAIANKWQSITLRNYEQFGRPQKADKEPVTNHPAGRVFRNGRFVDD